MHKILSNIKYFFQLMQGKQPFVWSQHLYNLHKRIFKFLSIYYNIKVLIFTLEPVHGSTHECFILPSTSPLKYNSRCQSSHFAVCRGFEKNTNLISPNSKPLTTHLLKKNPNRNKPA